MHLYYGATIAVPHLEHAYIDPVLGPSNADKKRIRLVPVGVERHPALHDSANELIAAIKHKCECRFGLHELSYCHNDVCCTNIIDFFGAWYLLNCEYACHRDECDLLATPATAIKKRFVMDTSKPSGPLFDLYQVGMLLADSPIGRTRGALGKPAVQELNHYHCQARSGQAVSLLLSSCLCEAGCSDLIFCFLVLC